MAAQDQLNSFCFVSSLLGHREGGTYIYSFSLFGVFFNGSTRTGVYVELVIDFHNSSSDSNTIYCDGWLFLFLIEMLCDSRKSSEACMVWVDGTAWPGHCRTCIYADEYLRFSFINKHIFLLCTFRFSRNVTLMRVDEHKRIGFWLFCCLLPIF